MAIEVRWHDESAHILCWNISGEWTVDEFYNALDQTRVFTASVAENASVIVNAQAVIRRPRTSLLPHFRNALRDTKLNTVVYVRNRVGAMMIEMVVNTIIKINDDLQVKHFKFAKTIEEAEQYCREQMVT